jgi:hypothetical protein
MKVSIFAIPKDSEKANDILLHALMKWEEIQDWSFSLVVGIT